MTNGSKALLLAGTLLLAGCNQAKAPDATAAGEKTEAAATVDHNDPVASAMAAAPAAIAKDAMIVQAGADGSMTTLRAGTNGWTCMPDNP